MAHTEYEEMRALRMISRGQGLWPLKGDGEYDEAHVAFDLSEPDLVIVYLRKDGEIQTMYPFRLQPLSGIEPCCAGDCDCNDEEEEEGGECECCGLPLDEDDDREGGDDIPPSDDAGRGSSGLDADADAGTQGELGF